jgi:hypothetical protein
MLNCSPLLEVATRLADTWLGAGSLSIWCALILASEAKIEIESKILFRLEAKKRHDFTCFAVK